MNDQDNEGLEFTCRKKFLDCTVKHRPSQVTSVKNCVKEYLALNFNFLAFHVPNLSVRIPGVSFFNWLKCGYGSMQSV